MLTNINSSIYDLAQLSYLI